MSRLVNLKNKSGNWILFIIRVPFRSLNVFLRSINSVFWSFFLNKKGKNVVVEFSVKFERPKDVSIGNNVYIGSGVEFISEFPNSTILIEDGVQINQNCRIDYSGNIIIRKNTLISANCNIFTHSHGTNPRSTPTKKPLEIKENCWIGHGVYILENVDEINDNVIIAARSTVTKSCRESHSIYAGVPAKKIKLIDEGK